MAHSYLYVTLTLVSDAGKTHVPVAPEVQDNAINRSQERDAYAESNGLIPLALDADTYGGGAYWNADGEIVRLHWIGRQQYTKA